MKTTQSLESLRIQLAADACAGLIYGIRCTPAPSDHAIGDPQAEQITLELNLRVEWEGSLALWQQAGFKRTERHQYIVTQAAFWRLSLHLATAVEDFIPRHVTFIENEVTQRLPVKSAVELAGMLLYVEQVGARLVEVETVAEHLSPALDPRDLDRIEGPRVTVEVDGYRVPVSVADARAMGAECAAEGV